jgi:hypothetical protein
LSYSSFLTSSKAPSPTFARPSVQRTTEEPGDPYAAIDIAVNKAGPRAVGPVSSIAKSFC